MDCYDLAGFFEHGLGFGFAVFGKLFGMPSFRLSLLNNHKEHITSDDDLILAKSEYVGKQMGFWVGFLSFGYIKRSSENFSDDLKTILSDTFPVMPSHLDQGFPAFLVAPLKALIGHKRVLSYP